MAISVGRVGQKITIRIERQFGGADSDELQRLVRELLTQDATEFIVDFAEAGYIDSRGLGALVAVAKQIRGRGASMRLMNLNSELRQLFALTRLDGLFDIGPDGGPHAA